MNPLSSFISPSGGGPSSLPIEDNFLGIYSSGSSPGSFIAGPSAVALSGYTKLVSGVSGTYIVSKPFLAEIGDGVTDETVSDVFPIGSIRLGVTLVVKNAISHDGSSVTVGDGVDPDLYTNDIGLTENSEITPSSYTAFPIKVIDGFGDQNLVITCVGGQMYGGYCECLAHYILLVPRTSPGSSGDGV